MKYFELTFTLSPSSETASDILSALLAEIGFETFVPEENGTLKAYVQQATYNEEMLKQTIEEFLLPQHTIAYTLSEPEDKDWNETWEEEGFEPIIIDQRLAVCDTRHALPPCQRCIIIHPRQAFGTGSHQTTRMILTELLEHNLDGLRVVDAGCGTGILGFMCLMQGAASVLAYDIDEWSVRNTLDNAALNFPHTNVPLEVRLGDSSVLIGEHDFDLLIANINRNILLADMEQFASTLLTANARIIISGFYATDVPMLLDEAAKHDLHLVRQRTDHEWAMLLLER